MSRSPAGPVLWSATQGTTRNEQQTTNAASSGRSRAARWLMLIVLALAIGIAVLALVVGPGWFSELPRRIRRQVIDLFLSGVLLVYASALLLLFAAMPFAGFLLLRGHVTRRRRAWFKGAFLLGLSCLLALVPLELGAAAWRAWMHRFPRLPTAFLPAPAQEYRIVVLGGSSALGEPYRPWLSVGQALAWQLQQAVPDRTFECEILAWLGDSLEAQHHKLAAARRRPHAVIIYSGHNEFAARFGEEHESYLEEVPRNALLVRMYRASLFSPFCRLLYEVKSRNGLDTPPLSGRHQLIDAPLCTPLESAEILADFGARLEAIVSYCDQIGAVPILIIPPANESGYEPSRSTVSPAVSRIERDRLADEFHAARAGESADPDTSEAKYRQVLARHPQFAEAHFRLARLLEATRRTAEAAGHYLAALDHDGLPIRCTARFRDCYVQVARRHPRAILIDGRRELSTASPTGLIGDHVIQDTHHPTLLGIVALAGAVLREMQARRLLPRTRAIELPLDPAACAAHFGLDRQRWATVCERTREHYTRVAGYRYDPSERLQKAHRYAEAAERLRGGTLPEDLGLPGVGASPPGGQTCAAD
jgi:hypothetical protein